FEVDSLAAERGLQSDLVERLVANLTGAGAQVCAAVQLVRNAGDVYAARRRPGGGELICEACLLRGGERRKQVADVHAVERGVERDVVLAGARDVQGELRIAAIGLREAAVGDARAVLIGFDGGGQRADVA